MRAAHWQLVALALLGVCTMVRGEDVPVAPELGESVVFIKNDRVFAVELETTVFRPPGDGPFPVVVIHHGKDTGNNHLQPRARFLPATREFLQRGYAVVLPMRQGFSKSGGSVVGDGCNIAAGGESQADEVRPVVAWIEKQAWADPQRMVMMGQSHGGLTTLAYAQNPHPGFQLFVNFAGGLRYTNNCQWELAIKDAFSRYGARTQVPSLWFYGENDSYFPPAVVALALEAYRVAGGKAEMVAFGPFGPFGKDAHSMFSSYDGLPIWWSTVQAKLDALGLPTAIAHPQFARAPRMAAPAASGFAPLADVDAVPFLKPSGRDGYRAFLAATGSRAFAIAPSGAWGWGNRGDDPLQRALSNCNRHGKGACRLYAVDDQVVWTNP
jgi:dienelactone hydrolase